MAIIHPIFRSVESQGIRGKMRMVFIITPTVRAGRKVHLFFNLLSNAMAKPARVIPRAIGRCRTPKGNPLTAAVARCPNPHTSPPSKGPKKSATKKPGAESKAREPIGLGILMSEPTALNAVKIASRAVRQVGEVLRRLLSTSGLGLYIVLSSYTG